ncbi:iron ABC transporter substrate-binding protein [Enemella sp. A6]|uniref:iron ABC transporter substrate-binding protein n=1 Tax=Enemella sp. A6 TaxID=3440152 RepID=UPI003EB934CB
MTFATSRRPLAALSALLLGLSLAACSNNDTTTDTPEGESDKKLTIYSGRDEKLVQPLIDEFSEKSGITVEVRYGKTAEMAAQLIEEGDRSPADLFLAQDAGALAATSKEGILTALPSETLDLVDETYRAKDGTWVGVTGRARVLVYNRDKVSEGDLPKSVMELTEPKWKGRVGVAPTNASFQAFVTAMRVEMGDDRTREWLKALAANEPQIREKNGAIVSEVADGTLDVGLVNHYYVVESAKEAGKSIDEFPAALHFFPDGDVGGLINVSGVALVGEQKDGDAQEFIDHVLSKSGQEYFREQTGEYPLAGGVDGPEGVPPLKDLQAPDVDLNDLEGLQETVQMISEAGLS